MKTRQEVAPSDCWNVEALYPSKNNWEEAFLSLKGSANQSPFWPNLAQMQGSFKEGPAAVYKALILCLEIERKLTKLYTYAHLKHDENIADSDNKNCYEKITALLHAFSQEIAWMQPELLSLTDKEIQVILQSPLLKEYRFYIEKIVRLKKHTLSSDNEKLLAFAGQALQSCYKTFNALTDADFVFPNVVDGQGGSLPLTHGLYGSYLRNPDRILRKNAFNTYHEQYKTYENTLCELLNGQVQNHLFEARARGYASCLEAALFPRNIETSVYSALIKAVNDRLPVLHKYMKLRKKVLKLSEMHLYDIYVPLTDAFNIELSYDEAEKVVIESVAPLGKEYQDDLRKGLEVDRWVDRFENKGKRSGGYSSGCYDSMPYILMNYKPMIRDVFTLAHEAGHSMHSFCSRKHQPYHSSDYPIFLAEVASTFNEDLLMRMLVKNSTNINEKIFLLNQKIEDIRATLFRQTMFAEFELLIHTLVEEGTPLTPELLKSKYAELNKRYFGPDVMIDSDIEIEWARIPHFYYHFYVFQYATGISAALSLSEKVNGGTNTDRDHYLDFLKSGSSKYPIDTLKMAGVDMTTPTPVIEAIDLFEKLLSQLEQLLENKKD